MTNQYHLVAKTVSISITFAYGDAPLGAADGATTLMAGAPTAWLLLLRGNISYEYKMSNVKLKILFEPSHCAHDKSG